MKKLSLHFAFALCLLVSFAVLSLSSAALTETGDLGGGITYSMDYETGTLTVSGRGAMFRAPKPSDKTAVRTLIIGDGITGIGMSAFSNYANLASVTLPASVTHVEKYAFSRCENLSAVRIENLAAFSEIWFSDKDSNPLYYAHHLYLNGRLLERLDLPASTRQIGAYAFCGGTDFKSVTIPSGVATIAYGAFSGCENLASIRVDSRNKNYICENNVLMSRDRKMVVCGAPAGMPAAFTVPAETLSICEDAFLGCGALLAVTPSDSTLYVGKNAFADTAWLAAQPDGVVYLGKVALGYKGDEKAVGTDICLRDGTVAVADYAFAGARFVKSVRIPASLANFGCFAFSGVNIESLYISDLAAWCRVTRGSIFGTYSHSSSYDLPVSPYAYGIKPVDLYLNDVLVENLAIPSGVNRIGGYIFAGTSIKTVSLPDSVTQIGENAFAKTVPASTYEDGIAYVDKWAVAYKSAGDDGEDADDVPPFALRADTVGIADKTFSWCDMEAENLTLPKSLRCIGQAAFSGMRVQNLSFAAGSELRFIGAYAFSSSTLMEVELPKSLAAVGVGAFQYCNSLRRVIFRSLDCEFLQAGANDFGDEPAFPSDTVLYGYADSTLARYAAEKALTFIALDKHAHVWGAPVIDTAATCTQDGEQSRYCTVPECKARTAITRLPKTGHSGDWTVTREPTDDGTPGEKRRICTVCGAEEIRPVYPGIPGDCNGDGVVDKRDLLRLQKYLADWDVEISRHTADCNGDGEIDKRDLLRLQKYLADWDVKLGE